MLDVAAETARYIDGLGADRLARAAAYTHGGHWLLLWDAVVTVVAAWLIVRSRVLHRVARVVGVQRPNRMAFATTATFLLAINVLTLPWTVYGQWWRERLYDRTSQPLADFLVQQGVGLLITVIAGALVLTGVYWLLRRMGRRWWIGSTLLVTGSMALFVLMTPTVIEPLFNEFKPVPPGPVREALVGMAAKAGIPESRLFVYDGSRQSNNFTANVGGLGSQARVAISDVALRGASLDEVKAVTGHEIGHYVLGHVWWKLLSLGFVTLLTLYGTDRLYGKVSGWLGEAASLQDPVGVPVLYVLVTVVALLVSPADRLVGRQVETAADNYSLRTVNLPDAMATALVKSADYRYPRPGPVEEALFYDHPSVERRVRNVMQWKATHP